jgi:predicted ATPase
VRIDSIKLVNFKAFHDLDLPLGKLTMLSGLNGSGKSSTIQAIGLLRQSFDSGALLNNELALNGENVTIGTGKDVLFQYFAEARKITIELIDAEHRCWRWSALVEPEADVLPTSEAPNVTLVEKLTLFRPGFQLLRADRITPSEIFPRSQHAVEVARSLGPRGEFTAHFLLKFGDELLVPEALRHPDEGGPSLNSQVSAWLQEFSPGVQVRAIAIPMTDLVRLEYRFREAKASFGDALRATNVGFGLTHALPVITACLAAQPDDLLVIENPEAQLHPRGQVALGKLLALTAAHGAQVLVETHSDHVLNGIRIAVKQGKLKHYETKLHFFARELGGSAFRVTPELNSHGQMSFWPEGFFDQLERSLDDLLA